MNFDRDLSRVQIFDTTNRDGEQATQGPVYLDSKFIIARALAKAGVDRIEAGFPSSSDGDFEFVRRIAREVEGSMIFGLSRIPIAAPGKMIFEPINITYDAVKDAQHPGIHLFSIMADPKSLKLYGYSWEQVVDGAIHGVSMARKLLGSRGQVEFSFQNAATVHLELIVDGYRKMCEAGADVINVPDTNGSRSPDEIKAVIATLRKELPAYVLISAHMHNDFGLAVANSLAAVQAGADIVEGTINGIGERAGNTALEEIVASLHFRPELYGGRITRVDTTLLNYLARLVEEHYGLPVQQHKPIVGENAFRHRAGIHQDGMVKGGVYQFIDPDSVGWTGESIELSARSGSTGLGQRLQRLGYDLPPEFVKGIVMPAFKKLADQRGAHPIGDADIVLLMDAASGSAKPRYAFVDMHIGEPDVDGNYRVSVSVDVSGKGIVSKAVTGKKPLDSEVAQGPISTMYQAIDDIVGTPVYLHLVSHDSVSIGVGPDSVAEYTVILSKRPDFDGKIGPFDGMYVGRGRHQNSLKASALAYIDALNKAVNH